MANYSIKDLEKLSGIKAHTIRIWEKRHNLITPQRTNTNIRYYSDSDLKKILNVSILNNLGHKISKISNLTIDELSAKVLELTEKSEHKELEIERMILSMIELDEANFEKLLGSLIMKYGFDDTVIKIIYPLS